MVHVLLDYMSSSKINSGVLLLGPSNDQWDVLKATLKLHVAADSPGLCPHGVGGLEESRWLSHAPCCLCQRRGESPAGCKGSTRRVWLNRAEPHGTMWSCSSFLPHHTERFGV